MSKTVLLAAFVIFVIFFFTSQNNLLTLSKFWLPYQNSSEQPWLINIWQLSRYNFRMIKADWTEVNFHLAFTF